MTISFDDLRSTLMQLSLLSEPGQPGQLLLFERARRERRPAVRVVVERKNGLVRVGLSPVTCAYSARSKRSGALVIRDQRAKDRFPVDDLYLNGFARLLGPIGTAVYLSLCRHADRNQECWPSEKRIAEQHGISDRSVRKYLRLLRHYNIIAVERRRGARGAFLCSVYVLLDKSVWRKPAEPRSAGESCGKTPLQRKLVPLPAENESSQPAEPRSAEGYTLLRKKVPQSNERTNAVGRSTCEKPKASLEEITALLAVLEEYIPGADAAAAERLLLECRAEGPVDAAVICREIRSTLEGADMRRVEYPLGWLIGVMPRHFRAHLNEVRELAAEIGGSR